jgi:(S)-3,5-dihydroxyphenylglycine transaminase
MVLNRYLIHRDLDPGEAGRTSCDTGTLQCRESGNAAHDCKGRSCVSGHCCNGGEKFCDGQCRAGNRGCDGSACGKVANHRGRCSGACQLSCDGGFELRVGQCARSCRPKGCREASGWKRNRFNRSASGCLDRQRRSTMTLNGTSLNPALVDLEAMNFLNEITSRFPQAISFGPGRPLESLFQTEGSLRAVDTFLTRRSSKAYPQSLDELGQYGRTKGLISDLVAEMLRRDEGIDVDHDSIVITVGSQEATFVVLSTLFGARSSEVLLVADPSYVGVTGAARTLGIEVSAVPTGSDGIDLNVVEELCKTARSGGRHVRALYVIPDFSNPHGTTMSVAARESLLRMAAANDFLILEDNAYGMFAYDGPRPPTLKALDQSQQVVYLGSFAKLLYPGLRVGFAVADQRTERGTLLADEIAKIKSMVTVNTPTLSQAIVGGLLLEHHCTLATAIDAKVRHYKHNRDWLLKSLQAEFGGLGGVTWNRPGGGFFLTLDLPFHADEALLTESAREHGVLWVPMRYFYLGKGGEQQARLSFSWLTPTQIEAGVVRLAKLVRQRIDHRSATTWAAELDGKAEVRVVKR